MREAATSRDPQLMCRQGERSVRPAAADSRGRRLIHRSPLGSETSLAQTDCDQELHAFISKPILKRRKTKKARQERSKDQFRQAQTVVDEKMNQW